MFPSSDQYRKTKTAISWSKSDMLLRVCVGWSCSLNNLWRCVQKNLPPPCERSPGEAPQVRSTLSRWTPGSSGYPAGRRKTADERGFYQAEDSFWIFTSECMFVCLCMFLLRLSFGDICVFCTLRMMSGLEASAGRDNTSPLMVWVWRRYLSKPP